MPFQVPFRRVELEGGSNHFDLYDTSGPQVRLSCRVSSVSAC